MDVIDQLILTARELGLGTHILSKNDTGDIYDQHPNCDQLSFLDVAEERQITVIYNLVVWEADSIGRKKPLSSMLLVQSLK